MQRLTSIRFDQSSLGWTDSDGFDDFIDDGSDSSDSGVDDSSGDDSGVDDSSRDES